MAFVKVLGAYGGKYNHKHTSTFVLSDEIVIDAGNIVSGLGTKVSKIRHIFLTHAHLDHVMDIPFLIDAVFSDIDEGITIHALAHTIESLQAHLLNDEVWPDFSRLRLPSSGKPAIVYHTIECGKHYEVDDFTFTPFESNHLIPTCGYIVEQGEHVFMLSGDTYVNDRIIDMLNEQRHITSLIMEVSFPSRMRTIARESKHLTPELAAGMLSRLQRDDLKLFFYHMKPNYREDLEKELEELLPDIDYHILDDFEAVPY